jgi:DNA-binding response OmpR family regulator
MTGTSAKQILVVEDDDGLRHFVAEVLAAQGFRVLDASTGSGGFEIIRTHGAEIDLAILDMVLPDHSGLDLAAGLDREHPGVKVLHISGYGDSLAMEVIHHRSPEAVLLKPFTAVQLVERVALLLGTFGTSGLPWDRLVEASDRVAPEAVLMAYKDTAIAFAVAAAHAAALRQAEVPYSFHASLDPDYRFQLVVHTRDVRRAYDIAASVGLGADIAPAA